MTLIHAEDRLEFLCYISISYCKYIAVETVALWALHHGDPRWALKEVITEQLEPLDNDDVPFFARRVTCHSQSLFLNVFFCVH